MEHVKPPIRPTKEEKFGNLVIIGMSVNSGRKGEREHLIRKKMQSKV